MVVLVYCGTHTQLRTMGHRQTQLGLEWTINASLNSLLFYNYNLLIFSRCSDDEIGIIETLSF